MEKQISDILDEMLKIKKLFAEVVDYFMVKDLDMRSKSELFFSFFHTLIRNVHKSMPEVEEKKEKPRKKKTTIKDRGKNKNKENMVKEGGEKQKLQLRQERSENKKSSVVATFGAKKQKPTNNI